MFTLLRVWIKHHNHTQDLLYTTYFEKLEMECVYLESNYNVSKLLYKSILKLNSIRSPSKVSRTHFNYTLITWLVNSKIYIKCVIY